MQITLLEDDESFGVKGFGVLWIHDNKVDGVCAKFSGFSCQLFTESTRNYLHF